MAGRRASGECVFRTGTPYSRIGLLVGHRRVGAQDNEVLGRCSSFAVESKGPQQLWVALQA
eukprot:10330135-Prorocentrum_lima.AAC.1